MIRILFADFDNTYMLHDYTKEINSWIPEENLLMTEEFEKAGGRIVITTGRGSPTVLDDMSRYGLILDVIGANGSAIRKRGQKPEVKHHDYSVASTMFENLMTVNPNIRYSHYIDDEVQYIFNNMAANIIVGSSEYNDYLDQIKDTYDHNNKCSIRTNTPEEIFPITEMLKEKYGDLITVSIPNDHELDITAKGVDKGSAIREVLDFYGLTKEEAAGIGDGKNDLAIMENVALKFAMANGDQELICQCVFTVKSAAEALRIIMKTNGN
ncbi:MAG: HAD family phosphatase [Erysipelotrichaceae bacterium]|nr:HAD family phosphatase [Erysipelotrichaceae bacterium]